MKIMNALLVMVTTMLLACSAQAEEFSPRNTLIIDQPIDRETMAPVMERMNRLLSLKQAPAEMGIDRVVEIHSPKPIVAEYLLDLKDRCIACAVGL